MEKYIVGAWINDDRWERIETLASSEREAKEMIETQLRWENPNQKVRCLIARLKDSFLRRLQ